MEFFLGFSINIFDIVRETGLGDLYSTALPYVYMYSTVQYTHVYKILYFTVKSGQRYNQPVRFIT
jgi:hypothetical protein